MRMFCGTSVARGASASLFRRDDIIATAGATQGLHAISHLLFSPGDIVFVENPTYFVATKIFLQDAEFKVKEGR